MPENGSREWSTPVGLVVCGWLLTAAAALWCAFADSGADRLFTAVLALVLAAASGYASLVRPRLRADSAGVTVRTLRGPRHHPWGQVDVQLHSRQRLGRTSHTLEIDADGGLVVLGRIDLGEDPQDVAAELDRLRR